MRSSKRSLSWLPIAFVVVSLQPLEAQVDCSLRQGNLIDNCGFEIGDPPVNWDPVLGFDFARSSYPETGDFSASIFPEPTIIGAILGIVVESDCFAVPAPEEYSFGGSFTRSIAEGNCNIDLESFSSDTCPYSDRVGYLGSTRVSVAPGEWGHSSGSGMVLGPFAQLTMSCADYNGNWDEPFFIDNAFALSTSPPAGIPTLGAKGILSLCILLLGSALLLLHLRRSAEPVN